MCLAPAAASLYPLYEGMDLTRAARLWHNIHCKRLTRWLHESIAIAETAQAVQRKLVEKPSSAVNVVRTGSHGHVNKSVEYIWRSDRFQAGQHFRYIPKSNAYFAVLGVCQQLE